MEYDLASVEIISGILPWFHAFGILTLFLSCLRHSRTVYLPKFQEEQFYRSIQVKELMIDFFFQIIFI